MHKFNFVTLCRSSAKNIYYITQTLLLLTQHELLNDEASDPVPWGAPSRAEPNADYVPSSRATNETSLKVKEKHAFF